MDACRLVWDRGKRGTLEMQPVKMPGSRAPGTQEHSGKEMLSLCFCKMNFTAAPGEHSVHGSYFNTHNTRPFCPAYSYPQPCVSLGFKSLGLKQSHGPMAQGTMPPLVCHTQSQDPGPQTPTSSTDHFLPWQQGCRASVLPQLATTGHCCKTSPPWSALPAAAN